MGLSDSASSAIPAALTVTLSLSATLSLTVTLGILLCRFAVLFTQGAAAVAYAQAFERPIKGPVVVVASAS